MNDDNLLGGVLGQLGQTVKQTIKQVVKIPAASAEGYGEPKEKKQQWQSDEERIKFLRGLYGKSDMSQDESLTSNKNANPNPPTTSDVAPAGGRPTEFEEQIKDKTPEEQKKLVALRQQLHKQNYYDPTFNPVKNQEERPAEKVKNEKKKETMELQQKKAEKPPPLAVVREQNKTEMFRGASG